MGAMGRSPEIAVVVATRNRAEYLERLLAGLRRQTLPPSRFEVVVVDDGSTDTTPSVLSPATGSCMSTGTSSRCRADAARAALATIRR